MRRPLVPVAVSFALGIWLADATAGGGGLAWALAGACLVGVLILAVLGLGGPVRFLGWLVVVASIGWARGGLPPAADSPELESRAVLTARAVTGWQAAEDRLRLEVEARSLTPPGGRAEPVVGRVRLNVLPGSGPCPPVLPGDDLRVWTRLRRPQARQNPGVRDPAIALRRRGIAYTGLVDTCAHVLVEPVADTGGVIRMAERARGAIQAHLSRAAGSREQRALFAALTVGESGAVPAEVRSSFQRAGLAHLLAISGLHLACVAFGFYWLLASLLARVRSIALRFDVRRLAALICLPAVGFYVLLAGASLPTVRAGVAVACFLVAVMARRRPDPFQTLAVAGLVVLGLWPQSLFGASFQLSFAAVATILLLAGPVAERLGASFSRPLDGAGRMSTARVRALQLMAVSFAATLGTAPLVALHFHQVSLVGLVSNLVAVPLAAWIIVPLGLATAICLPLGPAVAGLCSTVGLWLCGILIGWADLLATPSWSSTWVAGPGPLELLAWYTGLVCVVRWSTSRGARFTVVAAGLVLICGWAWTAIAPRLDDHLRVTALDVGQAEALLVELPGGERMLVDGAGSYTGTFDAGRWVVAPALWARGISRLDVVVVTHRHPDHVGGLGTLVRLFRPNEIWTAGDLAAEEASRPVAVAAREVGARIRRLAAGERPLERDDLVAEVLWPPAAADDLSENERSLTLRLRYGQRAILLTGDLEGAGEQGLLDRPGIDLAADVLKVGHHGSQYGTGRALLARVHPDVAMISVGGRNRYGLPHPDLLERLLGAGARVFRTDLHGAVQIETDGVELEVTPTVAAPGGWVRTGR